jgi:hypothetical protein
MQDDDCGRTLPYGRANPAILSTRHANFCHFKGRKVAQSKLNKLAFLVHFIHCLQRFFKRNLSRVSLAIKKLGTIY